LAVRADDQAEGLKIVDAAIKASGGPAKLEQFKAVTLKGKGLVTENGHEATFSFDALVQGQHRFKMQFEVNEDGRMQNLLIVADGDMGWVKHGDRVEDFPAEVLPIIQAELHALRAVQLLSGLKDPAVKLSPLGEVKVNDRAALGLKIERKDRPQVDLFFDKETNLPVKCQLRVKEPKQEQEVTHAWLFSGHKEIAGVKHPMKVTLMRDDAKLLEIELNEVKVEEKVDDNAFAKP
jgi:hypothetical protein